jgi:hypothetical protein
MSPVKHHLGESVDTPVAPTVIMWALACSVLTIYDLYLLGIVLWQTAATTGSMITTGL